jgi:hypothetical protein
VEYVEFQIAVIDLAASGVPLTVANVVVHLHVDPDRAEKMLDRMARDGRVDVEVDEVHATVVYRVRGLSTTTGRSMPNAYRHAWYTGHIERAPQPTPPKSVTLAVLLAALLPGFGLAYAAPLRTVLIWSLAMLFLGKLIGANLILAPLFWTGAIIVSALLGGLYAVRFNQEGHRAALHR